MGASLVYLDKPNKDIAHEDGSDSRLTYTASEMQGWRINMVSTAVFNPQLLLPSFSIYSR